MPKIIEDLPRRLMEEARRQVQESGYSALTIRSVAKGCGVGIGTVYNYYASRDALVASFLLKDWNRCLDEIHAAGEAAILPEPVLRKVYDSLNQFLQQHAAVFRDEAAASGFAGSFSHYHGLLRDQLAEPIRRFCPDDFTAEFIAEAILVWTVAGKTFDELYAPIQKLL
ncbi:MAG: TetR/AcrR family transcriptional regulator [Oscillospiraceae bacterium]|nr:TetR/AcrR family transcriptional regulator [Oscillospiraceae bacterium]